MTNQNNGQKAIAASEIEQARTLFNSIADTLGQMLVQVQSNADDGPALKKLPGKSAELQEALTRLNKMKDKFDEQYATGPREGEFDLDAARFSIGCKLARIRTVCDDGQLSGCPHGE